MSEQHNPAHSMIEAPGTQLHELTVRVRFSPENHECISRETTDYLDRIGALVVTTPEVSIAALEEMAESTVKSDPAENTPDIVVTAHDLLGEEERGFLAGICSKMIQHYGLTPRQQDVAFLTLSGKTDAEIATELGIVKKTVRNHMQSIYNKLDVGKKSYLAAALLGLSDISKRKAGSDGQ